MAALTAIYNGESVPATSVRALRNDTQVGVAEFTIRTVRKGSIYTVPTFIADHLIEGGGFIKAEPDATDDEWFDATVETDAELADRVRQSLLTGSEIVTTPLNGGTDG